MAALRKVLLWIFVYAAIDKFLSDQEQWQGECMTIYVDNMNDSFGRMKMCHMLADTDEELVGMAERIGVQLRWHQYPGTIKSHFDICLSKRARAVAYGAVESSTPRALL